MLEVAYCTWNAIGASQCKCPRGNKIQIETGAGENFHIIISIL